MNHSSEYVPLTDTDYARAERMLAPYRDRLIPTATVVPQWSGDGARFWYRSGARHILVEPASGLRRDAFDHERLAAELSQASGRAVEADDLPPGSVDFEVPDRSPDTIRFSAFDTRWEWSDETGQCLTVEDGPPPGPGEIESPDRSWVAFRRDGNVWVRSRDGKQEYALTDDAEPGWDYGGVLEAATKVKLPLLGVESLLVAAWSPDSTRLITHRIDQRELPEQVLVEAAPKGGGRPVAHHIRYPMPGDETQATMTWHVLDVRTGQNITVAGGPEVLTAPYALDRRWWTGENGEAVHVLHQSRDGRALELRRLDPGTGAMTTLITETGQTRVDPSPYLHVPPLMRVLDSGEILWWSQRDGWGHLYLYSADGEQLRQLTAGQWLVRRVLRVDEHRRQVWLLACGLNNDPYVRQICRVDLDGGGFVRITDDDLDHDAVAPPRGGDYVVDRASTVALPPRTRILGDDGQVLVELEAPDTTALEAAGWSSPERFRTTAADGRTAIYGLLWRPHGFDPARRYPVVDHTYPGPNIHRASPAFGDLFTGEAEALAALGFAVVALDGRGTPVRSKAFFDHSYGDLGMSAALDDHVAAIRELGRRHTWLDTNRVGITGHSGGGFFTARALLTHPDFYSVGVAQAGAHDFSTYLPFWVEQHHGQITAENRGALINTVHAGNLRGKLLLIDGELDDNVLPHQSMRLVDALIEADADVDMLVIPGVEHNFHGRFHYVTRRTWDYLARHLRGTEPPAYRLAPFPPMPDWAVHPSG
ncbi:S9 family peptidase [Pseudonocardia parietis]|uniref:Dipeptidyl aminopeptidase/acylaminoacyl peptidase n=1 Tax=Pseudonocardia parietis TaxID=570936 RepID=A0ABS4VUW8_9PSEU|nr:DPP IV N-terminal domain-containing protein [Pseudonocardia parietis]MBP2367538.1 dipeptidyl aminopeptidase/acylaminoacyl peptidase [Pseudonocardia parietis]